MEQREGRAGQLSSSYGWCFRDDSESRLEMKSSGSAMLCWRRSAYLNGREWPILNCVANLIPSLGEGE